MSLKNELVPAREAGSKRLMVLLHGLGDSMEGFRWMPEALGFRTMNYLLVNAPDPYYGGFSWYDIYGDSDPGIRNSRAELAGLLDALVAQGYPTAETTLFGFSQGCLMAMEMAARYPARFAGVIGVSGYVHRLEHLIADFSPAALSQRVLFTHGSQDVMVGCAAVAEDVVALKKAGMSIDWRVFPKGHEIAGEAELGLIRRFAREGYTCAKDETAPF